MQLLPVRLGPFYVAHSIRSVETRSLPPLTRSYPRHFTFYVAHPIRSIPVIPINQRHAAFRNSPLQKLQQTIFGDVMANEGGQKGQSSLFEQEQQRRLDI